MLSYSKLLLSLVMLILVGCGFQPMYKKHDTQDPVSNKLASIQIESVDGRMGQQLRIMLEDLLHPRGTTEPMAYKLKISLQKISAPFVIERDKSITRYNLFIKGRYTLSRIDTGKDIDKGEIKVQGSYDATESKYSTFVAENDAERNILKEMSEEFRMRLTSALLTSEASSKEKH